MLLLLFLVAASRSDAQTTAQCDLCSVTVLGFEGSFLLGLDVAKINVDTYCAIDKPTQDPCLTRTKKVYTTIKNMFTIVPASSKKNFFCEELYSCGKTVVKGETGVCTECKRILTVLAEDGLHLLAIINRILRDGICDHLENLEKILCEIAFEEIIVISEKLKTAVKAQAADSTA